MNKKDPLWIQTVSLAPPTLKDNTADADRLLNALRSRLNSEAIHLDLELLRQLPEILRRWKYNVRCLLFKARYRWELVGLTSPNDTNGITGLAVDLGTTRVVLRLINYVDGHVIAESAFDNPQETVGPDILARIHFADRNGGLDKLKELIIDGLNRAISKLCRDNGYQPENIYALSVAGNTTMTHLFLGLDPKWIIREPYIPVVTHPKL